MLKRKIKLLIIVLLVVNTASVKSMQSSSSVIQTYYEPANKTGSNSSSKAFLP
jgi:hypothetical protein